MTHRSPTVDVTSSSSFSLSPRFAHLMADAMRGHQDERRREESDGRRRERERRRKEGRNGAMSFSHATGRTESFAARGALLHAGKGYDATRVAGHF